MSGMGDTGKEASNTVSASGGSVNGLPSISSRLSAAEKRNAGPGILLPVLGVVGAAAIAYIGFYTITKGDGTLFPEKKAISVAAPEVAVPVVAAPVVAAPVVAAPVVAAPPTAATPEPTK